MIDTKFSASSFSAAWSAIHALRGSGKDAPLWAKSMIVETWDDDNDGMLLVSASRSITAWTYLGPRGITWPDTDIPHHQFLILDVEGSLANFAKKVRDSAHDVAFSIERITEVEASGSALVGPDWWVVTARSENSSVEVRALRYEPAIDWRAMVNLVEILDEISPATGVPLVSYSRALLKQISSISCAEIELAVANPGRPAMVGWIDSEGSKVAKGVAYATTLRAPAAVLDDKAQRALRDAEKFLAKVNPTPTPDPEDDPDGADAPTLSLVPDEAAGDDFDWNEDAVTPDAE